MRRMLRRIGLAVGVAGSVLAPCAVAQANTVAQASGVVSVTNLNTADFGGFYQSDFSGLPDPVIPALPAVPAPRSDGRAVAAGPTIIFSPASAGTGCEALGASAAACPVAGGALNRLDLGLDGSGAGDNTVALVKIPVATINAAVGAGKDSLTLSELTGVVSCTLSLGDGDDSTNFEFPVCTVDGGAGAADSVTYTVKTALTILFNAPGSATVNGTQRLTGVEEVTGGEGNDTITGSDGSEKFRGGLGDDVITGNGGLDDLSGGDGKDELRAADGIAESVRCGDGDDTAFIDQLDTPVGCEKVNPTFVTPPPAPPAPQPVAATTGAGTTDSAAPPVVGPATTITKKAKTPRVAPDVSVRGASSRRGWSFSRLRLTKLPAGASVEVRCTVPRTSRLDAGRLPLPARAADQRQGQRHALIDVAVQAAPAAARDEDRRTRHAEGGDRSPRALHDASLAVAQADDAVPELTARHAAEVLSRPPRTREHGWPPHG